MIDVEMWFMWCKGVVFGMVLSVIIKELGEWVRSRPTQRTVDVCPSTADGLHLWRRDSNGKYCFACGKRQ